MTTEVVEHPIVNIFRENGINVTDYEGKRNYGLIEFDGDQSTADKGMELVRNSDVELRALRYARYFGEDEETVWEILFMRP